MSKIDRSKPILVFLAASVQGSAVLRAAIARGMKVRAFVHTRRRAAAMALKMPGIEWAEGDLADATALRSASAGIDHAVLQLPLGMPETMVAQARRALRAFKAAGVKSFILKLSSASRPETCEEESFVANRMVEAEAGEVGLPFAIVRPTMYLDNLLKQGVRTDIMQVGVFSPPIPQSQRIAWTTTDDCAEAALTLLEHGTMGGDHQIAGPNSLTGDELAARVSAGLGRPVRYEARSLDMFERELDAAMGSGAGRRIASKYRYLLAYPEEAETIIARPFTSQPGLEGFRPTDALTWVRAHRADFAAP